MQRLLKLLVAAFVIGVSVFWWLTQPIPEYDLSVSYLDTPVPILSNGERIFWAAGCASCHAGKNAEGDNKLLLGGGYRLNTPFGTFITPNISPDIATGIGQWEFHTFYDAMIFGQASDRSHYYPAFPFASYEKMQAQNVSDLFSFLKTLPPVSRKNEPHELALPFRWRRPLGIWKLMFATNEWALEVDQSDEKLARGRYLVEALGHCGECHTPRNILGGMKKSKWLSGGPAPEGIGKIPNITPHEDGIGSWSEGDIVYYLETGFTPDFDSAGGSMVSVQENMAKLPKSDLEAIAGYLKAVPPVPSN